MCEEIAELIAKDIAEKKTVRSLKGQVEDLAQAYDIQDKVTQSFPAICGRKIAMNAPALMQKAGVSEPIAGVITGGAALGSGAEFNPVDFAELAIEPEFAAVIGKDIPAGTTLDEITLPYCWNP